MADKTCEERIEEQLSHREEYVQNIYDAMQEGVDTEDGQDPYDAWYQLPLAISTSIVVKIELSWGGPQDYILAYFENDDYGMHKATYHFLDWFDGAERNIDQNSVLWQFAEQMGEFALERN